MATSESQKWIKKRAKEIADNSDDPLMCDGQAERQAKKEYKEQQKKAAKDAAKQKARASGDRQKLAELQDPALAALRKSERILWKQAVKEKKHPLVDGDKNGSWLNWLALRAAKFKQDRYTALLAFEQQFEVAAYQKEKAEVQRQKEMMAKYAQNVQSFLYRQMPALKKLYSQKQPKEYNEGSDLRIQENIHKLADVLPAGSINSLIGTRSGAVSSFVQATPAQLALLQPLMRFFIVDQEGNEKEIYFSDYTTENHLKNMADLRASGDLKRILSPRSQRGSDAGIRSFTWNYNNKHEGDFIIDAEVELYFGTLAELANVNYLQFLFPTGKATELAGDLADTASKVADREQGNGSESETKAQQLINLAKKIDKLEKVLSSTKSDIEKVGEFAGIAPDMTASEKKAFRQLKVVVGWSLPQGNEEQLKLLFASMYDDSHQHYHSFRAGVVATQRAIFLNLADYNVDFTQEGPTTMRLRYIGSTDNYLATAGSDVFGSANLSAATNKFMFARTDVPIDGIVNENGVLVDVQVKKEKDKDGATTGYQLADLQAISDPYIKYQARLTISKNRFEEPTIGVTLAGLKKAQELVSLKMRHLQLMNFKEDSPQLERLRQSGQFLTLLYDRAVDIRIRDVYSKFLDGLMESNIIYAAAINPPSETGKKPTINFIESAENQKKVWDNIMLQAEGRQGPVQEVVSPNSTRVYFMRLGDIIRRALQVSGGREDVSLILGNVERFGFKHSLYDIPITVDTFGQFFFNSVVSRKRRFYPFRYFLNDMLKMVAALINQDPTILNKVAFDWSVISTQETPEILDLPFVLTATTPTTNRKNKKKKNSTPNHLALIRQGQKNPLTIKGKYHHFYPIYETKISLRGLTGNRIEDEKQGIYHYVIGSDRGLAKTFNFSRQETQYFQEMLIESNTLDDKIQALFLPQNVSITMYGNTLHQNGDLIFVDSRPSLGSFAGPVLGIGGYYRVIRSSHSISNRGYETTLDCVFELRVSPDKTGTEI